MTKVLSTHYGPHDGGFVIWGVMRDILHQIPIFVAAVLPEAMEYICACEDCFPNVL